MTQFDKYTVFPVEYTSGNIICLYIWLNIILYNYSTVYYETKHNNVLQQSSRLVFSLWGTTNEKLKKR
jgi:hypothetical protein